MAQLSLKITAEIEDPVWRWGRGLVSTIQRRARAEGVEVVFLFQAQNEGHFETTVADANAAPRIEPSADGSTGMYWTVPGFRHRCRCGQHFRFQCRADCRGPEMPVGVFAEERAYRGDAISDGAQRGPRTEETHELSRRRMREILEQRERGLSHGEIAKKMGVSPQRVRQLHKRALELKAEGDL